MTGARTGPVGGGPAGGRVGGGPVDGGPAGGGLPAAGSRPEPRRQDLPGPGRSARRLVTVVIPTIGRASLAATLAAIEPGPQIIVVDDRPGGAPSPLPVSDRVRVLRCGGRGPAAARNLGWRAAGTPWVAFLDDDVVPAPGWVRGLVADLARLPERVGGSQGRLEVPLPAGRRPTDDERDTAGLAGARWVTADMAYRRAALEAVGGFDERFPGAYREDGDLALRVERAGFLLVRGQRVSRHPVRDDGFWSSVRRQRGNAADALVRRVHGRLWRAAIGGHPGRLKRHALTTAAGLLAVTLSGAAAVLWRTGIRPARSCPGRACDRVCTAPGHCRGLAAAATAAWLGWLGLTAQFAWSRIAPGPRTRQEVLRMAVTSLVIPPLACAHRIRGELAVRRGGLR